MKASPNRQSFNAGEHSVLMEGRTDIDRYNASMRISRNFIALPQGPLVRRSGTKFMRDAAYASKYSAVVPFVFNESQSYTLEFGDFRMRILTETGVQTYAPTQISHTVTSNPLKLRTLGFPSGASVGEQVVLTGFPASSNLANLTANVVAVTNGGADITLDVVWVGGPAGVTAASGKFMSRVYSVPTPYPHTAVRSIRYLQDVDVIRLFCDGYRNYKLSRFGQYDWRLAAVEYLDGPFLPIDDTGTTVKVSDYGAATPAMTSATTPSGTANSPALAEIGGREVFRAFDKTKSQRWQSSKVQEGYLRYTFPTPTVVNGYVIYLPEAPDVTAGATYALVDYSPADWRLRASTDAFVTSNDVLDVKKDYLLYENGRSVWFKLNNAKAYSQYQLEVTACRRNGPIGPMIGELVFSKPDPLPFTLTFSKVDGINGGEGFKTTDVDRLLRIKDVEDGVWRTLRIVSRVSATVVTAQLLSEPFTQLGVNLEWRIGYFSDTTGWPVCATFFEDRLCVAGPSSYPDLCACSRTGLYEDMQQVTPFDEVLDDSAIVFRAVSRKLSRIRWLTTDERGLLCGSGSQEFVVKAADDNQAFTAKNIRARSSTRRGSANMEPVQVDRQVLYVQAARKTVREFAYVFEADGYKSPSMSLFASHLGAPKFAEMDYAADPHSIVWIRRDDGKVVGLTYNRDENVVGWHQHDFASGIVESLCVVPSAVDNQDALWMVVNRTINGQTRRYIERLMRFWDFDSTLAEAHFVDCAIRYEGVATNVLYGLSHLEGCIVDVLVDGVKQRGLTVTNGSITLNETGTNIIVGLPYESFGEISRIEAGAADGTAQGKTKRIHNNVLSLWDSAYGEVGVWLDDKGEYEFSEIEYPEPFDELEEMKLQTCMTKPLTMPPGYGQRGTVALRQTDPYPYNCVALMPQLNTQDR